MMVDPRIFFCFLASPISYSSRHDFSKVDQLVYVHLLLYFATVPNLENDFLQILEQTTAFD
jgi:hypothetical protein